MQSRHNAIRWTIGSDCLSLRADVPDQPEVASLPLEASVSAITSEPCLPLLVIRYDRGGTRVLELSGECDLATRQQLENALAQALSTRDLDPLVLDLSRLEFCDVGCTWLVCEASRQGRVALAAPAGIVGKVVGLLDPAHRVPRYDDVNDALASFAADGEQLESGV
jgi:hypothetical protein